MQPLLKLIKYKKRNCLHNVGSFFSVLVTQTILQQQSHYKNNRCSSNIVLEEPNGLDATNF